MYSVHCTYFHKMGIFYTNKGLEPRKEEESKVKSPNSRNKMSIVSPKFPVNEEKWIKKLRFQLQYNQNHCNEPKQSDPH